MAFDILVTVPEGVTQSLSITDLLPAGLVLASSQVLPGSFAGTVNGSPTLTVGAGGSLMFDFGNVTAIADNNPATNSFTLRVNARVENVLANQVGTTLTNTGSITYIDGTLGTQTVVDPTPAMITVGEPILALDKVVTAPVGPVGAGQTVTYTVTLSHALAARARRGRRRWRIAFRRACRSQASSPRRSRMRRSRAPRRSLAAAPA